MFELREAKLGSTVKAYNFVQCAKCGGVVGVVEGIHLSTWLWKILQKLGIEP